mmetsp:Transcript_32202/g.99970  ORF Transcript_32202/g.99970 Transcript_32202/m.99970 type:complete len:250 (-) Transcript_32202:625-1374(-)
MAGSDRSRCSLATAAAQCSSGGAAKRSSVSTGAWPKGAGGTWGSGHRIATRAPLRPAALARIANCRSIMAETMRIGSTSSSTASGIWPRAAKARRCTASTPSRRAAMPNAHRPFDNTGARPLPSHLASGCCAPPGFDDATDALEASVWESPGAAPAWPALPAFGAAGPGASSHHRPNAFRRRAFTKRTIVPILFERTKRPVARRMAPCSSRPKSVAAEPLQARGTTLTCQRGQKWLWPSVSVTPITPRK